MKVPLVLPKPAVRLAAPRVPALPHLRLPAWLPWALPLAAPAGTLVAVELGRWWLTPLAGVLLGLGLARPRRGALLALASGAVAWTLPLAWLGLSAPVWRTAGVLSGILGVGVLGPPAALFLTALLGAILTVAGAWVGAALRSALET